MFRLLRGSIAGGMISRRPIVRSAGTNSRIVKTATSLLLDQRPQETPCLGIGRRAVDVTAPHPLLAIPSAAPTHRGRLRIVNDVDVVAAGQGFRARSALVEVGLFSATPPPAADELMWQM